MTRSSLPADRIWDMVVAGPNNCWVFTGTIPYPDVPGKNHGSLSIDGENVYAHRHAWALTFGPIPEGLCVLHKCDNPPCVNPDHLKLGTRADNVADREARGRGTTPPSRRKLTETQVVEIRSRLAAGENHCRIARDYPITRSSVRNIALDRTYQEVGR